MEGTVVLVKWSALRTFRQLSDHVVSVVGGVDKRLVSAVGIFSFGLDSLQFLSNPFNLRVDRDGSSM